MWLSVLGPLYVRGDDGEVVIPAAKQRVVLAALLVHANNVMSFDELAAVVWEGTPPPTARATLRNYVKWLRRLLGPVVAERIITRDPGYLIRLAEDELDSLRLRALCDEGGAAIRRADWPRAAAVLSDALSLWRGTPLADIPSETLRRDAAVSLDRLRLRAAEWRVDAELHLGRPASVVLELQELTAEQPLHERFHAQLMVALYQCGRAAEALAVYEQARQLLAERLGADPGPDLRRLHERILRSDPTLLPVPAARSVAVPPPAVPGPPPGGSPPASRGPQTLRRAGG